MGIRPDNNIWDMCAFSYLKSGRMGMFIEKSQKNARSVNSVTDNS